MQSPTRKSASGNSTSSEEFAGALSAEVKSASQRVRSWIALPSPNEGQRGWTIHLAFREKGAIEADVYTAVRSLAVRFSRKDCEVWAEFTNSAGNEDGNSPQFRLTGGEGGILLAPLLLSACDPYTLRTIASISADYKGFHSWTGISTVPPISWSFRGKWSQRYHPKMLNRNKGWRNGQRQQFSNPATTERRAPSKAIRTCAIQIEPLATRGRLWMPHRDGSLP